LGGASRLTKDINPRKWVFHCPLRGLWKAYGLDLSSTASCGQRKEIQKMNIETKNLTGAALRYAFLLAKKGREIDFKTLLEEEIIETSFSYSKEIWTASTVCPENGPLEHEDKSLQDAVWRCFIELKLGKVIDIPDVVISQVESAQKTNGSPKVEVFKASNCLYRSLLSEAFTNFGNGNRQEMDALGVVEVVNSHPGINRGHEDWRLPTIDELEGLALTDHDPGHGVYWSCTPTDNTMFTKAFDFGKRLVLSNRRNDSRLQVMLVRTAH